MVNKPNTISVTLNGWRAFAVLVAAGMVVLAGLHAIVLFVGKYIMPSMPSIWG